MTAVGETQDLPQEASYTSPSGASEIRVLPAFAAGELTHAHLRAGGIAKPAWLEDVTEMLYVLHGTGELWRSDGEHEQVVDLRPGRCVSIPSGIAFQYRAAGDRPLGFLVAATPRWEPRFWHESPDGHWDEAGGARPVAGRSSGAPWGTADLRSVPDYAAPDGSEIRLLLEHEGGGLAHCRLPAGATSRPVVHATVEEIWFVIGGYGELWRAAENRSGQVVALKAGRCCTIPRRVAFQFRNTGADDLLILIATMPRWPGPDEAAPAAGVWTADE